MQRDDSNFTHKGPCSACGSSDGNAHYDDGHTFCFVCEVYGKADGEAAPRERRPVSGLITGEVRGLRARKITDETCKHFGYMVGNYRGKPVHIAPYYNADGQMVAQHLRTEDKDFPWLGDASEALPFGAHAFQKSGKMLTLVEGEIDAMAMSQVQGNKWPVWSIGCGAGQGDATKVRKYIAKHLTLFRQFEKVVIMFDNDEPGRDSAKAAASVIGKTAHIAELPLKDASDMLKADRVKELLDAMWRAVPYRPEGMVDLSTLKDKVMAGVTAGLDWCLPQLTKLTFGKRRGEVYAFGAGTGVGKTELFMQEIEHTVTVLQLPVGVFLFEQNPDESARRLAGKIGRKPFHIPDAGWVQADLDAAWAKLEAGPKVFAYDSFGNNDWEIVKERIRYLVETHSVKDIFIDHLTALAAWQDDERKALELIMSDIGGLVKELGITVYLISHLATPEGKPHEEGGRVMIRHFKGSRAIGFWCHYMFALERNQQDDDPTTKGLTTFRVLKDRYTGRSTGATFFLRYDHASGMLEETDGVEPGVFGDESKETNQKQDF
jgi:twinkle protein